MKKVLLMVVILVVSMLADTHIKTIKVYDEFQENTLTQYVEVKSDSSKNIENKWVSSWDKGYMFIYLYPQEGIVGISSPFDGEFKIKDDNGNIHTFHTGSWRTYKENSMRSVSNIDAYNRIVNLFKNNNVLKIVGYVSEYNHKEKRIHTINCSGFTQTINSIE